jgi:hypothetical protein
METAARALHQALIQGGNLQISDDQVSRYIEVSAPDVDMSWFVYPYDKPITINFLAEFPFWQDSVLIESEFVRVNLIDRGGCEGLTSPMIYNETTPVKQNCVWDRSLPIDRGDCESTTSPMVNTEITPLLSNVTWARDNTVAHQGTYSYKLTKTIAAGTSGLAYLTDSIVTTDLHGFVADHTYTFAFWVYVPSVGGPSAASEARIGIGYYDSGVWTDVTAGATGFDAWELLTVTITLPATATGARIRVNISSTASLNEFFYVDDVVLDPTQFGTYSYRYTKTIAAGSASAVYLTDTILTTDMHGLEDGQTYTFRAYIYIPTESGILGTEIVLRIEDYIASWESSTQTATNTYDSWQLVEVTRTIRSGATGIRFNFNTFPASAIDEYFFVDTVQFNQPGTDISAISIDLSGSDYIVYPEIEILNNYGKNNPTLSMKNVTDGNMEFEYNDSLFVADDLLEIDSTEGTVLKNNNNAIENFDPARFLRLQPKVNSITYTGEDADITFKYRKVYF